MLAAGRGRYLPSRVPPGADGIITIVTELSVLVSTQDRANGARTLIRLTGEADATTPALAETLAAECARKPRPLLLDMAGLAFIDSAAIHDVIRAHRALRASGGRLALISPSPIVARILQLTAVDTIISVHPSADDAGPS
jgi:anti-anti-sigma factor